MYICIYIYIYIYVYIYVYIDYCVAPTKGHVVLLCYISHKLIDHSQKKDVVTYVVAN